MAPDNAKDDDVCRLLEESGLLAAGYPPRL
jgi:hypothetical protein